MPEVEVGTAALASAGSDRVAVILGLEPAWPGARVSGRAFTVRGSGGDNLAIHRAVARAGEGEIVVVDVEGEEEVAHCGDILVLAAAQRGIRGIILDGSIRDRRAIAELRFPVFHRGTSPRRPAKAVPGQLGIPVRLRGATVNPGDYVCADDDGVVVIPAGEAESIVDAAAVLEEDERSIERRILAGETTMEIFGLAEGAA
jgi:4-hydroxy-4-methyl-2-oxoglutarate aldolase